MTESIINRFWAKVDKNGITMSHMDTPCWNWTACKTDKGYGLFWLDGRSVKAHRMSWIITNGTIPQHDSSHGWCVIHNCDNPSCVRPNHIRLGTNQDNMDDKMERGRNADTAGEKHWRSQLTNVEVIRIRQSPLPRKVLASHYSVNCATITKIINRQSWQHI